VPVCYLQYWQLRPYGVAERHVRGNVDRRPDESWPLPEPLKIRLGVFLKGLGFDPGRDIFVRDLPAQKCFHLTQRAEERKPEEKRELRWHERRV
jgi:hypothetical protein